MAFKANIESVTTHNKKYRKVLFTDKLMQLVVMCLKPGEFIPWETHKSVTQFFRVEGGRGIALVGGQKFMLKEGDSLIVPKGTRHKIIQTGRAPLRMYTIYTPPNHPPGTVHNRQPEED